MTAAGRAWSGTVDFTNLITFYGNPVDASGRASVVNPNPAFDYQYLSAHYTSNIPFIPSANAVPVLFTWTNPCQQ